MDERRQVTASDDGEFAVGDGREPSILSPEARVSMNLWGFTPSFHITLQKAMEAATEASEEAEVLLPEVVAHSLDSTRSPSCRRRGAASASPTPTIWLSCKPSCPIK